MESSINWVPAIPSGPAGAETLVIRVALRADAPELRRLAQLDSAPPPETGPMLVAEVDGELRAALPLRGGVAIANPFRSTAELIGLLNARARELEASGPRPTRRRWPSIPALRPAPAPRA
jgi:hypothetical protein